MVQYGVREGLLASKDANSDRISMGKVDSSVVHVSVVRSVGSVVYAMA